MSASHKSKTIPSRLDLNIKYPLLLLCLACLFPLQAFSDNAASAPGWTGQLSLSVSASEGNTNLGNLNVGFLAKHENLTPWAHLIRGSIKQAKSAKNRDADKKTTKDIKRLSYKVDYKLGEKNVIVGYVGYEEDRKVKLDSELTSIIGIERRKIGTKNHQFIVGAGIGKLKVKYTDGTDEISATAGRAGLTYKGKLTKKLSFDENLIMLYSKDRTMKRATSNLNYALTKNISLGLAHEVTLRNKVANTATDRKDNTTSLNLIIKF